MNRCLHGLITSRLIVFLMKSNGSNSQCYLRRFCPAAQTIRAHNDADAVEYLDRLLAMDASTYYEIPDWQKVYPPGLKALDAASQLQYGSALGKLNPGRANSLLANLSQGLLTGFPAEVDQKKFFATLRMHCIEACFSDPRWGGNKGKVIWRWIGYLEPAKEFHRS